MCPELAAKRRKQARKYLKPLPRKATLHRYPVLKYFKGLLRSRSYLWDYKAPYSTRAIYIGSVVTFMPLIGVQILVGALLALLLRANIVVVAALQFVSNPLTGPFMYLAGYWVGAKMLGLVGMTSKGDVADGAIFLVAGGIPLGLALGAAIHLVLWLRNPARKKLKMEENYAES